MARLTPVPLLLLSTLTLFSTTVSGFPANLAPATTTDCDDVHIFLARGTWEDYPGRQINVVYAICNGTGTATCDYEDIEYPATLLAPPYCDSEGLGVAHGTTQISEYATKCPDSQLVLSGYSQGAQVVGNILGGQSGGSTGCTDQNTTGFDPTTSPATNIKAVTLFGDVTHVGNQTYNTANGSALNGIDPRTGTQLERLNTGYSSVLQSWCLSDDPICAQGDDDAAHTSYFDIFSQAAGDWVLAKLTL
ncbi:family 5 carbohydrate esterase [Cryphonectria parasitica EP155]|uniref:Cutinase n=1 Tax=Cryphonectria parasitica (strain ATCC 38755 / EP155) TaxID=660469 RepID=A0A9P5CQT0_CRYP1|nr:family 5 carbohydrate esterase [Cryphonectria parasitica EP155]KAF3766400.1 family 5 carbohydrate esterase [Cryphonectria parasitica EP155]